MSLISLPLPCWTFTCTADSHDRLPRPHYAVRPGRTELPGQCDRPYQINRPCVIGYCDSCGTDHHHPGTEQVRHFDDHHQAAAALTAIGWTSAGADWHCPNCPAFLSLTDTAHAVLRHAA